MNPVAPRLGKPRLLIVGCGDTGLQVLDQLAGRLRVFALSSSPARFDALRAAGALPLAGDLDRRATLARLRGLARAVLMLAPPAPHGTDDPRSARLGAALRHPGWPVGPRPADAPRAPGRPTPAIVAKRPMARRGGQAPAAPARVLVYASTTGVYGDAGGARVAETRPPAPASARARRRIAAETHWRAIAPLRARRALPPWRVSILRIPGIYGPDRLPLERLRRGLPALVRDADVYTNHIALEDLARAALAALWRGRPQRIVHACDGQDLPMGDYFDAVADAAGLPRPPRLPPAAAEAAVSPAMWSFMRESRRLDNRRLRDELGVRLRYPTVDAALRAWFPETAGARTASGPTAAPDGPARDARP